MSSRILSHPARFAGLHSEGRSRVFVISELSTTSPRVEQVATIPPGVEVNAIVDALNSAAWSGSISAFETAVSELPEPVVISLRAALENARREGDVLTGFDGVALSQLSEGWMSMPGDVEDHIEAAFTMGTELLMENTLDEDETVRLRVRIFSGETAYGERWRGPVGDGITREVVDVSVFVERLREPRASREEFRAFTAWVPDDDDPSLATGEIVLEYLGTALDPENNFRVFIADDRLEPDSVLTERNRMLLWRALNEIAVDLDGTLADGDDFEENSGVYEDMPEITHGQSHEWWRQLEESAQALTEAARKGDHSRLVPRTPGEEALIALATSPGWIEMAQDMMDDFDLRATYEGLPESDADGAFPSILGELTGDTDVEMLWGAQFAGIEDPGDERNQYLGMGDYRPDAWHTVFPGREPEQKADTPGTRGTGTAS